MRLIDLDAKEPYLLDGRYAVGIFDNAPIVFDKRASKERTQGEWKVRPRTNTDGGCAGYELYCSKCESVKTILLNRSFTIDEAIESLKRDHKNFCEECGADMRSENKFQDLVVFDDQPKRQLEDPDCHNEL